MEYVLWRSPRATTTTNRVQAGGDEKPPATVVTYTEEEAPVQGAEEEVFTQVFTLCFSVIVRPSIHVPAYLPSPPPSNF